MATVSEMIVTEYFEMLGYLVLQPCKYVVTGRPKRMYEEIDLMIQHPMITEQHIPQHVLWTMKDLKGIARAVVGVYGWHSERFYPTMFENLPEIVRFASQESLRLAAKRLGTGATARILCLPQLPASEKLKDDCLRILKQKGIDGVLSFRSILLDLINHTDSTKNYEKTELLQIIRILKSYDLLKDRQLELFHSRKKSRRHKKPTLND